MDIIRFADLPRSRWRNGGGTTVEIARGPAGAGADEWDWRLSIADVERAGGFSAFPGMDRVLTVVDGELLVLAVGGCEHGLERYRPFRFDGGAPAGAVLPTGSIRDLGLITRRGAVAGYVTVVELSKKRPLPLGPGQLGVLLQGEAMASPSADAAGGAHDGAAPLARYDSLLGGEPSPAVSGRGFLAVVSIVQEDEEDEEDEADAEEPAAREGDGAPAGK